MEEKNETGQDSESSSSQASDSKSSASDNKSSTAGNVTDKIIADVKKFNLMSLIGLGLVIAFLLFMFINGLKFKWWLMLPLAGAAGFILYRQLSDTQGFEKKVCFYGLIFVGALVLLRDIQMSNAVEGLRSFVGDGVSQMNNAIKKLKLPVSPK